MEEEGLLRYFVALEETGVGTAIRNSIWAFPVIEAVHLLGLCLLGGAALIVDLRMLGVGLTQQRIADLARYAQPWLRLGVGILLSTGALLFLSESVKLYYNTSFWVKMSTLPVALVFTFVVRRKIAADDMLETSVRSRLLGAVSIVLWFTVAAAGRWIGYS